MLNCVNRAPRARAKFLRPHQSELNDLYRSLSLALDRAEEALEQARDSRGRVCLAVLEEDLQSLLEECEDMMFCPTATWTPPLDSVSSRADTVIEELDAVLSRHRQ